MLSDALEQSATWHYWPCVTDIILPEIENFFVFSIISMTTFFFLVVLEVFTLKISVCMYVCMHVCYRRYRYFLLKVSALTILLPEVISDIAYISSPACSSGWPMCKSRSQWPPMTSESRGLADSCCCWLLCTATGCDSITYTGSRSSH